MNPHEFCKRCHCCTVIYEECDYCGGEGYSGHDCGEDTCCCLDPEDNLRCDICRGRGGFEVCIGRCDANGLHDPA
jgi:hypothetical protein